MDQALDVGGQRTARQPGQARQIFQNLYTVRGRPQPGARASRPTSPDRRVADLELPPTEDGVYLIGCATCLVEAGGDDEFAIGRGRIFMPLVDEPGARPLIEHAPCVQVTSVVPRPADRRWSATGVLTDDHLADELAGTGPADRLLSAAEQPDGQLRGRPGADRGTADHARAATRCSPDDGGDHAGHRPGGRGPLAGGLRRDSKPTRDGYRLLYGIARPRRAGPRRTAESIAQSAAPPTGWSRPPAPCRCWSCPAGGAWPTPTTVSRGGRSNPKAIAAVGRHSARGRARCWPGPGRASDRQLQLHRAAAAARTGPPRHRRADPAADPGRHLDRGHHVPPTKRPAAGSA